MRRDDVATDSGATGSGATGSGATGSGAADRAVLHEVLHGVGPRMLFQPVVQLDDGAVVGWEALARGPVGHPLERPDLLFAAARRAGLGAELDVACVRAALRGARTGGLGAPFTLFVNVEPGTGSATGRHSGHGGRHSPPHPPGGHPVPVVVEITERALTARPAELLDMVARIRARGWGIAVDDVGADRASLALLPLLRPDVVKLDLRLVQDQPSAAVAEIVNAVAAEVERSGTTVLAEGIETERHLEVARSLGATLGQGWLFGRPGPLPHPLPQPRGEAVPVSAAAVPTAPAGATPFSLVEGRRVRRADKALLIELSKQLERQALASGECAVLVSTFQEERFFTADTRRRYARLAGSAAFLAALGVGMPVLPLPGVRGGPLAPGDPVCGEWDVAVLGPHFAATLLARDLGDTGPDAERRFDYVLSHDRALTVDVAQRLVSRVSSLPAVAAGLVPGPRGQERTVAGSSRPG